MMRMILVAPLWLLGLAIMAVGTYIVLACEWMCDDLKGAWS